MLTEITKYEYTQLVLAVYIFQRLLQIRTNTIMLSAFVFWTDFSIWNVSMYLLDVFSLSPGRKERSSRKEETKKDQRVKNKSKEQDSKFPATDGVNLEYFLSELSDDDNSSW